MARRAGMWLVIAAVAAGLFACGGSADRKAAYMAKGRAMYEQGNYDKARVELSNVLQIDPKDVEARFLLAETLMKKQDYGPAAGHYLGVIEEDPTHVQAHVKMGELYLLGGAPDKTAEMVEAVLKLDPDNADAIVLRGSLKAQKDDLAGALVDAEKAMQLAPDSVNAAALTASLYMRRKDTDRAISVLQGALKKHSDNLALRTALAKVYMEAGKEAEAERELAAVVKAKPEVFAHRLQYAAFLTEYKRLDQAEAALREAVTAVPSKDRGAAKLALTQFIATHRNRDQALAELQEWVQENPKEYELRLALGNLYAANNETDKAKKVYRSIIAEEEDEAAEEETGPHHLTARTQLAALALRDRDTALAEKLVSEVLTQNSRDTEALTLRGQISVANQDYTTAIGDFRTILKDAPDNRRVQRMLARAHMLNKEPQLARDTLKEAVERSPTDLDLRAEYVQMLAQMRDMDGVVDQLNEVLAISPNNFVALETLFKVHASQKDWAAAMQTADRLKSTYPDRPHGYYFAGLVQQAKGEFEPSLTAFEEALQRAPDAVEPISQIVKSHLELEQPEKAHARLDRLIAEKPENAVPHNLKGELHLVAKKYDEAIDSFKKATSINPKWSVPYTNTAAAYERLDNDTAAIETLQRGIGAVGDAATLQLALAGLYERMGKWDDAIAQYEQALQQAPDALIVANNLAMLLVDHRKDETSMERAKKLIEPLKTANNAAFLDTVGWVQLQAGDLDAAVPNLEQAVKAAPEAAVLHYHLGMAYLKKGDRAAALESLKKAVDTKVPYTGLDEAKSTLQTLASAG